MCVSRKPGVGCTFPARDVTILSLCLTLNIYTLVNLFPYVGVMVKDLLELETTNELGYHAGYVASAFMFGRFVSGYPLGYLADFIGRKPVIIGGLISIMLCSLAFGLSPTFGFALTSRFVLGLTNGIAPALRTTMRDLCGLEHVMKGMTYLGGGKAASLVLGTAVGGLLAQPALNYPSLFSENGIFGRYPFLLPNLLGSIAAAVLLPVVVLFIPETKHFEERRSGTDGTRKGAADEKPPKEASHTGAASGLTKAKGRGSLAYLQMTDRNDGDSLGPELQEVASSKRGTTTESAAGDDDGHGHVVPVDKAERGLWGPDGVLAVPHVKMVLFLVFLVQALVVGFEEAYPLWALSTPDRGGLGWDTIDIGKVLLSAGVLVAVVHIGILPGRAKSLGITTLQRMGCLVAILTFVFVPFIKVFSWNDSSLHVVSAISIFFIYCGMGVVILALTIASTTMVPSDMCGTLSGLFNSTESLGRFVGPVAFATMFAWSISTSSPDWVNHYFVFFGSAFSMVFVSVLAWATITDENITHKELNSRSDDTVADRCGSSEQEAIGGPDPIACSTTKIDLV